MELITGNTAAPPSDVLAAAKRLAQKDVAIIIGPFLSEKAALLRPFIDQYDGAILSPTVATDKLTGIKDHFFRLMPSTKNQAKMLADYVIEKRLLKTALLFGDTDNAAYVNSFNNAFAEQFTKRGGTVTETINLALSGKRDWTPVFNSLKKTPVDTILISASSINTAALAQELHRRKLFIQILGPSWAFHKQILMAGGRDIEGILLTTSYNPLSDNPKFIDYTKKFRQRFGESGSSLSPVYSYEAAQLVFQLLKETNGNTKEVLSRLEQGLSFNGLHGRITLDAFGDVNRESFLMTIKNGQFFQIKDHD